MRASAWTLDRKLQAVSNHDSDYFQNKMSLNCHLPQNDDIKEFHSYRIVGLPRQTNTHTHTHPTNLRTRHHARANPGLAYGFAFLPLIWNTFDRRKQMYRYRHVPMRECDDEFHSVWHWWAQYDTARRYLLLLVRMRKCGPHRPNRRYCSNENVVWIFCGVYIWRAGARPHFSRFFRMESLVCMTWTIYLVNSNFRSIYARDAFTYWMFTQSRRRCHQPYSMRMDLMCMIRERRVGTINIRHTLESRLEV